MIALRSHALPLHGRDDRGVVTAMFAVLAVFFFLIISVVAEGGRKLSNLSQAEDLAAEAARSAAATLDLSRMADGVAAIDEVDDRACNQAAEIVSTVTNAEMTQCDVSGGSVLVTVRVSGDSILLGFNIDGVGSHRAAAFNPFA